MNFTSQQESPVGGNYSGAKQKAERYTFRQASHDFLNTQLPPSDRSVPGREHTISALILGQIADAVTEQPELIKRPNIMDPVRALSILMDAACLLNENPFSNTNGIKHIGNEWNALRAPAAHGIIQFLNRIRDCSTEHSEYTADELNFAIQRYDETLGKAEKEAERVKE